MNPLRLTKQVPETTKTITARWCKRDFTVMSPNYRAIRSKCGSPMDSCYWCHHKIADGEVIALAALDNGNKVFCQPCADELLASAERSDPETP